MMQEAFGAYRAVVAGLGEAERRAAWAEVGEVLAGFEADGRFEAECGTDRRNLARGESG